MGGCVPATIMGCILPQPIHEHFANEVETHFIKHSFHHLYLIFRVAVLGRADTNQMRRLYMKKLLAGLLLSFPTCVLAEELVKVEVVNEPLLVEHAWTLPSDLRSSLQSLSAPTGQSENVDVSFNDFLVELQEISWAPTRSTGTGSCQIRIRINKLIAFVGKWEPPVGNVKAEIWQPPGGIVGIWEPPGGIVFTPNDTINIEVRSVNTSPKDNGVCEADFVVLATNKFTITDGN
jgi:hypothetical protein